MQALTGVNDLILFNIAEEIFGLVHWELSPSATSIGPELTPTASSSLFRLLLEDLSAQVDILVPINIDCPSAA